MLSIDHLNLHLPVGFEHRASSIARLVASELAAMPIEKNGKFTNLQVPEINIHATQSNRQAANRIAQAIHRQIGGTSND